MITLMIVDDHPVVRDGLRGLFATDPRFDVVAEAADGAEAITLAQRLHPAVILMDLRMPGLGGVAAIEALADAGSSSRVVVLTTYDTDADVLPAIEAGAIGFLLKDASRGELHRAVEAAARGESVLAPAVLSRVMARSRQPAAPPLSPRELEVLELIARGCSNREAARRLLISEATVKTHLLHAFDKLGVRDRTAAVATAIARGHLTPPPS